MTHNKIALAVFVTGMALALAACGSDNSTAKNTAGEAVTTTSAPVAAPFATDPGTTAQATPTGAQATATTTSPAPTATTAGGIDYTLPSFVGKNLQDSQDEVQESGIFYSRSHDLRGSRHQIIDSDWQVCDQTPAVGTHLKGGSSDFEGKIDFGVVKLSEFCP